MNACLGLFLCLCALLVHVRVFVVCVCVCWPVGAHLFCLWGVFIACVAEVGVVSLICVVFVCLFVCVLCCVRCVREFCMRLVVGCCGVAGVCAFLCGWCCGAFGLFDLLRFLLTFFFVGVVIICAPVPVRMCAFHRHGKYHRCCRAGTCPFWTWISVGKSGGQ